MHLSPLLLSPALLPMQPAGLGAGAFLEFPSPSIDGGSKGQGKEGMGDEGMCCYA